MHQDTILFFISRKTLTKTEKIVTITNRFDCDCGKAISHNDSNQSHLVAE